MALLQVSYNNLVGRGPPVDGWVRWTYTDGELWAPPTRACNPEGLRLVVVRSARGSAKYWVATIQVESLFADTVGVTQESGPFDTLQEAMAALQLLTKEQDT